ncbi:hypothetical protein BCR42DRAFT_209243 [Absidia repens]|uniref:Uncharacterized protein n=1 Tax=Absidia repens TaxID=90262 RepID=A0A1X2IQG4_9FUNG|nr:hypothetical protein BCR42DRAFT_209243 [Absidia repens]
MDKIFLYLYLYIVFHTFSFLEAGVNSPQKGGRRDRTFINRCTQRFIYCMVLGFNKIVV